MALSSLLNMFFIPRCHSCERISIYNYLLILTNPKSYEIVKVRGSAFTTVP